MPETQCYTPTREPWTKRAECIALRRDQPPHVGARSVWNAVHRLRPRPAGGPSGDDPRALGTLNAGKIRAGRFFPGGLAADREPTA